MKKITPYRCLHLRNVMLWSGENPVAAINCFKCLAWSSGKGFSCPGNLSSRFFDSVKSLLKNMFVEIDFWKVIGYLEIN